jgi:hypothetical protein
MNYDLAMMALEGLSESPARVRASGNEIVIEGSAATLRELARLFLLLGGDSAKAGDEFELIPDSHLTHDSMKVRLRRT